jgi:IS30 family transposase
MSRPKALTAEQSERVRQLLLQWPHTIVGIAREVGVSRSTIYRAIAENGWDEVVGGLSRGAIGPGTTSAKAALNWNTNLPRRPAGK